MREHNLMARTDQEGINDVINKNMAFIKVF